MQEDFGNRVLFFAYIKSHCELQERNHLNIKSRNTCIQQNNKEIYRKKQPEQIPQEPFRLPPKTK